MSKKNKQQTPSTLKQLKEVAGLFTCLMEHRVIATEAQIKWEGPKIPPEVWNQVLAFFQWTYDESKSESQVRLYVNTRTQTWAAWAYPQEAKTGMSAKELEDHPKFGEQRLQFNRDDKWIYFGTAHHHCACGAFQSQTDERGTRPEAKDGEINQDGLHITVGNMDKDRYTIHDRFYLSSQLVDHQLDWFWDIGDALDKVPDWCKPLLPADIKDRLARGGMCVKPPKDTEFPQQWKDNLIYTKPVAVVPYNGGLGWQAHWNDNHTVGVRFQRQVTNLRFDLKQARDQFTALCAVHKVEEIDALEEMFSILKNDGFLCDLMALMYRNDVSLDKLAKFIEDDLIADSPANVHEQVTGMIAEGGVPDWDGPFYGPGTGKLPQ